MPFNGVRYVSNSSVRIQAGLRKMSDLYKNLLFCLEYRGHQEGLQKAPSPIFIVCHFSLGSGWFPLVSNGPLVQDLCN